MHLFKNLLRIITAAWQHLCIISNSVQSKSVRKLRKHRQIEFCPVSSPLGDRCSWAKSQCPALNRSNCSSWWAERGWAVGPRGGIRGHSAQEELEPPSQSLPC